MLDTVNVLNWNIFKYIGSCKKFQYVRYINEKLQSNKSQKKYSN